MFYADEPIASREEDQLDRGGFAALLARALINLKCFDTFSVGLYGKWGSGKTSIVNMTLEELEKQQENISPEEKMIVVRFEPWNFSDTDQLLTQFFVRLSNELRSEKETSLSKVGDLLVKYSDMFQLAKAIPVAGEALALVGERSAEALGEKLRDGLSAKDIQQQKETIQRYLRKQKQKILVVMDDLDRLSDEQIRQIFQLVASIAKFPNMIYLVAFDQEIVAKALKEVQRGNGEAYLEKIIQMPIQVPKMRREKLRNILLQRLDQIVCECGEVCFQQRRWQELFWNCVDPFLKTIRDVNRLCNSVRFKLAAIGSEVDFADMVGITVLEIVLPQLYEWVKENRSTLTTEADLSELAAKKVEKAYEKYSSEIRAHLPCGGDESALNTAISSLARLFPPFGRKIGKFYGTYNEAELRRENRISHPDKFNRYFDFDLDGIKLKRSEVQGALYTLREDELCAYLLECAGAGESGEFLKEMNARLAQLTPNRAKVILKALLTCSAALETATEENMISSGMFCTDITIIDLLEILAPDERASFFSDIIREAPTGALESIAEVINLFELSHGRLAAKEGEEIVKKVLTLKELLEIEPVFTERVKQDLKGQSLFDFKKWNMICYLLEHFDATYMREYLEAALQEDRNVVGYLNRIVYVVGLGISRRYYVDNVDTDHLTKERIMEAIQSVRVSRELFSMPKHIQNKCAAFFLKMNGDTDMYGDVFEERVNELLDSWENPTGTAPEEGDSGEEEKLVVDRETPVSASDSAV